MVRRMEQKYHLWKKQTQEWQNQAREASKHCPLKSSIANTPNVFVSRRMRLEALWWVLRHDHSRRLALWSLKHPFSFLLKYPWSLFCRTPYRRVEETMLYGFSHLDEFYRSLQKQAKFCIFTSSYCEKPLECPAGRFTETCLWNQSPVCQQCPIGYIRKRIPDTNTEFMIVPTVNAFGLKVVELVERIPSDQLLFVTSACELSLQLFADLAYLVGVRGIGLPLRGRVCQNMKAFTLAEVGCKPTVTYLSDKHQELLDDILYSWQLRQQEEKEHRA